MTINAAKTQKPNTLKVYNVRSSISISIHEVKLISFLKSVTSQL